MNATTEPPDKPSGGAPGADASWVDGWVALGRAAATAGIPEPNARQLIAEDRGRLNRGGRDHPPFE